MGGTTPTYGFPFPTGTDRVMDGDNAIEALARAVENALVARGFPSNLTVPGTINAGSTITTPGGIHAASALFNGPSGEITACYGGGGLAIAQGSVATHGNGVVLWVSGASLYARKSNGADVLLVN